MSNLSVCMITYNHAQFLKQAIEGVMMQKCTFPVELVIGEDCSTDDTRKICLEFHAKYPDKIRLLLPENNIGANANFKAALQLCTGKYLALCEGDDYWTDPFKLQKQVDFLEAHPEYMICFHAVDLMIHKDGKSVLTKNKATFPQTEFSITDLLKYNFINTPSLVIRNTGFLSRIANSFDHIPTLDWMVTILASQYGKIHYIPESMAVYRMHEGGIHSQKNKKYFLDSAVKLFEFLTRNMNSEFRPAVLEKYRELLSTRVLYAVKEFSQPEMTFWFGKLRELTSENRAVVVFRLMTLTINKLLKKAAHGVICNLS